MSDLQSLSELYQNKLFRIPNYQRGYAWKHDQLVDFWDVIVNLQGEPYHKEMKFTIIEVKDAPLHLIKIL